MMDELHTINENVEKVEALVSAITRLQATSATLTLEALLHQIESIKILSDEAFNSFETMKNICLGKTDDD